MSSSQTEDRHRQCVIHNGPIATLIIFGVRLLFGLLHLLFLAWVAITPHRDRPWQSRFPQQRHDSRQQETGSSLPK